MFAGFGGQGIMMIGKLFAYAAMQGGKEVAWIPSYGPEMRGGTAYCTVVVSDRPVGSPIISNPDHLVIMNRPSLEKFAPVMKTGGVCMVNSSLISINAERDDIDEIRIPCNELAIELGNPKVANITALGAFAGRSKLVDFEFIKKAVEYQFGSKPKLIPLNLRALERGAQVALEA
jgi:2-oxoglutarate ferredoxin oxidoreductase subunit gamma